ncbi:MAG: hypothetical protein CMO81_02345 [Waddliaceae bacterium]|nr:hypothetical protein [Waddliaceae bacterium]
MNHTISSVQKLERSIVPETGFKEKLSEIASIALKILRIAAQVISVCLTVSSAMLTVIGTAYLIHRCIVFGPDIFQNLETVTALASLVDECSKNLFVSSNILGKAGVCTNRLATLLL